MTIDSVGLSLCLFKKENFDTGSVRSIRLGTGQKTLNHKASRLETGSPVYNLCNSFSKYALLDLLCINLLQLI